MERVVHDLARGTAERSIPTTVIAHTLRLPSSAERDASGASIFRARPWRIVSSQPISFGWIRLAIREARGADVVVVHAPNPLAIIPALAAAWSRALGRGPAKLVLVWHSDIIGKGVLGRLTRPVEHLLARCATHIIATSEHYAAASAVLARHRAKLSIIPIGIDPPPSSPAGALSASLSAFIRGRPLVIAVGRLVKYKGFRNLVEAAASCSSDFALLIVGAGPLEQELAALIARLGLTDKVRLTGQVDATELDALYRAASLYVMSSNVRAEAFGVVLIEAMSHAIPIVATDIPGSGVPWVVENGRSGMIVPPDSPGQLAEAMDRILGDSELASRLAEGAISRFQTNFTREIMTDNFLDLVISDRSSE